MKYVHYCAAMALAFVALSAGPAFAQAASDTNVSLPWGDAAAEAVTIAGSAAWLLIAGVLTRFAGPVMVGFRITGLDQLLEKTLKGVFEKYADELRGKALTVDLKNAMVAEAARLAIEQGSKSLIKWAGAETIQQKILARWSDTLADWFEKQK